MAGIELSMASQCCKCGHQKRDHNIVKSSNCGSCKICLCNSYVAVETKLVTPPRNAVRLEQD